jgi:PadR family transcriptional regulator, regulatory protein PadR
MRADVLKGHLDLLLLAIVEDGPHHGYAVIEELRRRTDGAIDLPEGTIYPALHRLERAGLLTSAWSEVNGRRRRTYTRQSEGRKGEASRMVGLRSDGSASRRSAGMADDGLILMRRLAVLATLAVVTTIAACGSDEDRLTSEEFLEQGNAICEASNAAIEEASAPFAGREPTPDELAAFIEDALVPSGQGVIDDIGHLSPPKDMQDVQSALDEVVETPGQDAFSEVNASANDLGLTACGGNEDSGG